MKIYCFSGLGADERVFKYLKLNPEFKLVPVPWIEPLKNESLESYSKRISACIPTKEEFGVLGVSFGGVIAQEVSAITKPNLIIGISTINRKHLIPRVLRMCPNWLLKVTPEFMFSLPKSIANYIFGVENKKLLDQILNDTSNKFTKWAIQALKNWKAENGVEAFFVSGEKDRLLKPFKEAEIVKDGHYFMI